MNKLTAIIIALSLLGVSCTTVETASTTKKMDIYGPGVIQYPVIGEMDVDIEKVTGKAVGKRGGDKANSLKISAVNDAIKKSNADVLIEPVFDVVEEGNSTTVTVNGFPATYTNFRPITHEDVPLLKVGQLQTADVYETNEAVSNDQDSNIGTIIGILSGLGVLGYAIYAAN